MREEVHLTDCMRYDPLEMLLRCGIVSKSKLIEGHRRMLFTGSGLLRKHLSKEFVKSVSRHLCKSCAKAKIEALIPPNRPRYTAGQQVFGEGYFRLLGQLLSGALLIHRN